MCIYGRVLYMYLLYFLLFIPILFFGDHRIRMLEKLYISAFEDDPNLDPDVIPASWDHLILILTRLF